MRLMPRRMRKQSLITWLPTNLLQQSEDGDSGRRPHVHLAIHDRRRAEVASCSEVIAISCSLIAVVELLAQIASFVSVQHRGALVLNRPHDSVRRSICRYAWRTSRVGERNRTR